jgi:BMFP domain-containing protein YqiC
MGNRFAGDAEPGTMDPKEHAMQTRNPFLDDLARVFGGAMGTMGGLRESVETRMKDRLAVLLAGMDLPSREEFEAVKAMAAKARSGQEALEARVAALEARCQALETAMAGKDQANQPVIQTADAPESPID